MSGEVQKHALGILNYQLSSNQVYFKVVDIFNH